MCIPEIYNALSIQLSMIIDYDIPDLLPELFFQVPTLCQLHCHCFKRGVLYVTLVHLNDIFGNLFPDPFGHVICDAMLAQVLGRTDRDHVGL